MKNILKKVGKAGEYSALGVISALLLSAGIEFGAKTISTPIKTQQELEKKLAEGKSRLGISDPVTAVLGRRIYDTKTTRNSNGEYSITLSPGSYNTASLNHELYHIADGDFDRLAKLPQPLRFLDYAFWEEPTAALHSLRNAR